MNKAAKGYDGLLQENERLRQALEKAQNTSKIYTNIANALSRDYTDLFYVNMDTDEYIEYHSGEEYGALVESRRGSDFFESCVRESGLYIHTEDREAFVKAMNREFLLEELERNRHFEMIYRRIKNERVFYVRMKVSRMVDDHRLIVIAVSDIDELMKKRRAEELMEEERIVYARLHAITGNYMAVYVVEPETGCYREFSSTDDFAENLSNVKPGTDFFENVRAAAAHYVHPADRRRYRAIVTRENIMAEIGRSGSFSFGYRFMMKGKPIHVLLKAAMMEEKEGPRLIIGLKDIDAQVRQEEKIEKRLARAESQANVDALTGVKNKHAYLEAEAQIDHLIAENRMPPFAIVMMDMNDLKKINDTTGHQAGDQYIRSTSKIICNIFKHSPVFRIGGDEFAVIAQGNDYECLEERLGAMKDHNIRALQNDGIVIACGMARYEEDSCFATVFDRADHVMYENKNRLKSAQKMYRELVWTIQPSESKEPRSMAVNDAH